MCTFVPRKQEADEQQLAQELAEVHEIQKFLQIWGRI